MSYMEFFTWSVVLLAIYYAINIAWDTAKGKGTNSKTGADNVLHFTESVSPTKLATTSEVKKPIEAITENIVSKPEPLPQTSSNGLSTAIDGAVEGMGVSLKGLFELARTEAIEFTKPVSFQ